VIAAEQLDELWKLYVDETNWRLDEQGSPHIEIGERVVLIHAVEDGAEAIGAIAVGRDLNGALSIIEQGGPCNAPLPVIAQRAVRKWIGQANAVASGSA
jgi:hypothetical protein